VVSKVSDVFYKSPSLLPRDQAVSARDAIAQKEVIIEFNLLRLRIHHSSQTFQASA
jgi:hypothetical protein